MWLLPLLLLGAVVVAAASRSPRERRPPQIAYAPPRQLAAPGGSPGPIAVLGEFLRVGHTPPPPVILGAIGEAEAIGRYDLASDIVRRFVDPVMRAHQVSQVANARQAGPPIYRSPAQPYARGSCAPPSSPRSAAPVPMPMAMPGARSAALPSEDEFRAVLDSDPSKIYELMSRPHAAAPHVGAPAVIDVPQAPRHISEDQMRSMLDADPARFTEMVSRGRLQTADVPATPPAAAAPPAQQSVAQPREADRLLEYLHALPGFAGAGAVLTDSSQPVFEVRWQHGFPPPALPPMIDGHSVRLVVIDQLPQAQPTGLPPERAAQMQESAGLPTAADETCANAIPCPIPGVSDETWRQFLRRLERESLMFNSARHVGRYRQRRERLAELGINPSQILGSAQAQRSAIDADLADANHHAMASGLAARHLGRSIMVPGVDESTCLTLSGLLGVIQCAGLEGAVGWLEQPGDRRRYPNTTQAFLNTNGIF